jgi:mRNA interferase MazF
MPRGDIYLVELPSPVGGSGREQSGQRPAVVVLSDNSPQINPMTMVVPLTGQLNALRFPHTFQVDPSPTNGLSQPSVLLVFQLRAIDRQRLRRLIGQLENNHLQQLNEEINRLLDI